MPRIACIHVPAFPLQVLLRQHPTWRGRPACVVAEDRPQARVLQVSEPARRAGVLPGMRFAAALSISSELNAGVIDEATVHEALDDVTGLLRRFSPHIERQEDPPGPFWLDADGLGRLHPSLGDWGLAVQGSLREAGWLASVVVGFRRYPTYAVATQGPGVLVFPEVSDELMAAQQVPLSRLDIAPDLRDTLARLGVSTLGGLAGLPPTGLHERFGEAASRLRQLATGELDPPLRAIDELEPARVQRQLPSPERRSTALLFVVKGLLPALLRRLSDRSEAVRALELDLELEDDPPLRATVRPAEPTLDERQLLDLVRLKLEALTLPSGCEELTLGADTLPISWEQAGLFTLRLRRDLEAAGRALARVRAELGEEAVVRAELRPGHLPEARYRWVPLERLRPARPASERPLHQVRRLEGRPRALAAPHAHLRNDGWLPAGARLGAVIRDAGPFHISGGWWRREIRRAYHFLETQRGDLLWAYWDSARRRWVLQGRVE